MLTRQLFLKMSISKAAQPISLFCSQISNRRFGNETLRLLESLLVCKDVESLMEVQSSLTAFTRSELVSVMREITGKTDEQKLVILEFFVRAFALLGDTESCLALKYEALLLRDLKFSSLHSLEVSHGEWLNFAEQLLDCGFYPNARQACENALSCLKKSDVAASKIGRSSGEERVRRLQDKAVKFSAAGSVQAQAADYLKGKTVEKTKISSSSGIEQRCAASTAFRNGIKKRNVRQLCESQQRTNSQR
ncbi:protein DOUBLE-STRAND BREAK FORMATION [Euphorbia lathyris]|uniref:protein DOUBLE-STRAND BREAK FORMATION n=1 Tax=Euphorbia lathyris TaxID=212925 RepID=UPI0033141C6B